MAVNTNEQLQKVTCEKCSQNGGDVYSFHYGKKNSETSRRVGNATIHTTKYDIAGEKNAAVCGKCIRQRRIIRLVVFGLMIAVGAGIAL